MTTKVRTEVRRRFPGLAWKWLLWVTVVGAGLTACDGKGRTVDPRAGATPPPLPPRKVQTARVTERQVERSIVALGSLVAHEQARLSAKVPGRVQAIPVDLGSRVQRGDVLVRIDSRDYELRVQQAAAALAQARAVLGLRAEDDGDQLEADKVSAVKAARAVLDEAQAQRDRLTRLSKEKIISASEVDAAQSAYLVALNRYADAQEKVRQGQALVAQRRVELEIAQQQLADSTMAAPFDGDVQERRTDVGEYLTVGTPVLTLVGLDPLRLRVEVSERDAPRVQLGQPVRFTLEGDTRAYTGLVQRLSPALAEPSRMLVVEADIPNDGRLRPGYFTRAQIVTAAQSPALTVPTNAVITFAGLEKAFVVEQGKAVERRLVTRDRFQNWVEVVSGLKPAEPVILNPGNLRTGQPVILEPAGK